MWIILKGIAINLSLVTTVRKRDGDKEATTAWGKRDMLVITFPACDSDGCELIEILDYEDREDRDADYNHLLSRVDS